MTCVRRARGTSQSRRRRLPSAPTAAWAAILRCMSRTGRLSKSRHHSITTSPTVIYASRDASAGSLCRLKRQKVRKNKAGGIRAFCRLTRLPCSQRATSSPPMLEGPLALDIVGDDLAASPQLVFVRKQSLQTNGAARVQLAVADADLCAQAVAKAVGKAGGSIVKDAGRVDFVQKDIRGLLILSNDALRVARAVMIDVFDGLVEITHDLDREFQIAVFSVPIFFFGGNDVLPWKEFNRARTAPNFYAGGLQCGNK